VNVGAEAGVVSDVPTRVVGIVVDYDLIAVPVPVSDVGQIKRRDAPVKVVKPESIRIAAAKHPDVFPSQSRSEMTMRVRMSKMETSVVAPFVVSDPPATRVDVRSIWMALGIAIISRRFMFRPRRRPTRRRWLMFGVRGRAMRLRGTGRPVFRDITTAHSTPCRRLMFIAGSVIVMLCRGNKGDSQQNGGESE
jgi:hypothetical protein